MKKIIKDKFRISLISDIRLNKKTSFIYIMSILASVVVIIAMIKGIYNSQEKKHDEMQKTIVTASH